MKRRRYRPRTLVHPFGPLLFMLLAAGVLGLVYLPFGIGRRPLELAGAGPLLFAIPVVLVFGIAGLVWLVIRIVRQVRGSK